MHELALSKAEHETLISHLFQEHGEEEAAFVFAAGNGPLMSQHIVLVPVSAFAYKSRFGFELTDEFRGRMIKEAHDRNAVIVECHSHPFPSPARFSPTDIDGLREFVPHVQWRLKGKPYGAVVLALTSFDSFFWRADQRPEPLCLNVDGTILLPNRRSLEDW